MMLLSTRFIRSLLTSSGWWLGVGLSIIGHLMASQVIEEKTRVQFEYVADNALMAIQNRVRSYIDVLRGSAALFYTADQITRQEFQAYVSRLDLERTFPGITNLNFAQHVTENDRKAFEAMVRSDTTLDANGYPDFAIKPTGMRSEYHVLTYLEPMKSNFVSFGFDIISNKIAESHISVMRDNGKLISSGRLIRIEGAHKHVGLAMRMPVYRRGMPIDTVEQRRRAFYGSVGAGFDVRKLMTGVIDVNTLRQVRFRLYDIGNGDSLKAGTVDPERLLFDSNADNKNMVPASDLFMKRISMTVGPRVWEAEFSTPKSAMTTGIDEYLSWLVLIGGLIASTLLYTVYYSQTTARRRAVEIATEMTRDLRTSEATLAEAQHMAHLGSWALSPGSRKMTWSAETYRIFGASRYPDGPLYDDFLKYVHDEDRTSLREGLDHTFKTGDEFTMEHRIVRLDGSLRWVQTIARVGQDHSHTLLRGSIMDITERKHTVEALKRSRELLRELTAHQDRVKEDERKRIAREIHDELGQTLLALRIDVSMLDARTALSHPRLNEKVRGALQHIDATVKTIRTIINNLRPAVLDLGLSAAIEWQVSEFRRRSGIACDLRMSKHEFAVDDARATSLFRILQESLTNVIRHANASHVLVEVYQEEDRLVMKITDNGIGIYPDNRKATNSFGLVGVEERIHALSGEFFINSAPGEGTTLTIYIPLEKTGDKAGSFQLIDDGQ